MGTPVSLYTFLAALSLSAAFSSSNQPLLRVAASSPSFLQTKLQQFAISVPADFGLQTLFYIGDEDEKTQVAIDFSDARAYAEASLKFDSDELTGPAPGNYMTGDLYDNDRSDTSKLSVKRFETDNGLSWGDILDTKAIDDRYLYTIPRPGYDFDDMETFTDMQSSYQFNPGDVTTAPGESEMTVESSNRAELTLVKLAGTVNRVVGDRLEVVDEDDTPVLFSQDGYDSLKGDFTDNGLSDESDLTLRVIQSVGRAVRPIRPTDIGQTYDLDDLETITNSDEVVFVTKSDVVQPFRVLKTRDIRYVVDDRKINQFGKRYSQDDADEVPILYSIDSGTVMVGDLYDNNRTDSTPLRVVTEEEQTPITWFRPPTIITVPAPAQPRQVSVRVQEEELTVKTQDVDDLTKVVVFVSPDDIRAQEFDELPSYSSSETEEFMVGDLYDNQLTDNSKLDVVRVNYMPPQPQPEEVKEVKKDYDLDEVENLYVNRTWADTDVSETETGPESEQQDDIDELIFVAPSGYMTGDLYDNFRSDSSKLLIRFETTEQPLTWAQFDRSQSKDIYRILEFPTTQAITPPVDTDDWNENIAVARITDNTDFRRDMSESALQRGDRLAFVDEAGVPVLYSSDQKAYVAGDLFANDRSDSAKLRVVLKSATLASLIPWSTIQDEPDQDDVDEGDDEVTTPVRNPGFLE